MKRALVISGGGSKGAFAVGAVKHLVEKRGLAFDIYAGTSTGALIVPLLAARGEGALPRLVEEYTTVHTDQILTPRTPEEVAIRRSSVFTTERLAKRIKNGFDEAAFQELAISGRQVFLSVVGLRSGRLTYYHTGHGGFSTNGELVQASTYDLLVRAMLASASIPVLMQPVPSASGDGELLVDGGVREYAPIQVAIDAGATEVVAVILSPERRGPAKEDLTRLPGVLQRTIDLLSEEVGEGDLTTARLHVEARQFLSAVTETLVSSFGLSRTQAQQALSPAGTTNPFATTRATTLKIIRPTRALEGETLKFDPKAMKANLDFGRVCAETQFG